MECDVRLSSGHFVCGSRNRESDAQYSQVAVSMSSCLQCVDTVVLEGHPACENPWPLT